MMNPSRSDLDAESPSVSAESSQFALRESVRLALAESLRACDEAAGRSALDLILDTLPVQRPEPASVSFEGPPRSVVETAWSDGAISATGGTVPPGAPAQQPEFGRAGSEIDTLVERVAEITGQSGEWSYDLISRTARLLGRSLVPLEETTRPGETSAVEDFGREAPSGSDRPLTETGDNPGSTLIPPQGGLPTAGSTAAGTTTTILRARRALGLMLLLSVGSFTLVLIGRDRHPHISELVSGAGNYPDRIEFPAESAELSEDQPEARALLAYLRQHGGSISLTGCTESTGNLGHDAELAKRRAVRVRELLRSAGIADQRIVMKAPRLLPPAVGTPSVSPHRVEIGHGR